MAQLFAHYPADPDAVEGRGRGMLTAAQLVSGVKEHVSRSHRNGFENLLGDLAAPFVGSLDPVVRDAEELEDRAAFGCGAVGFFADGIRQYNGVVTVLNALYAVRAASGFGVPEPADGPISADAAERQWQTYEERLRDARRGLVADLSAREAFAEAVLDARGAEVARMLDSGPNQHDWLVIHRNGNGPDGYVPVEVQQVVEREVWETTLPSDRVVSTDYGFEKSGGGVFFFEGSDGSGWYIEHLADGNVRATKLSENSVGLDASFGARVDFGDRAFGAILGAGASLTWADSKTWVVPADELADLQMSVIFDDWGDGDLAHLPEPERVTHESEASWFAAAEVTNRLLEGGFDLETAPAVEGSYTLANGDTGIVFGSQQQGSFHAEGNVDPLGIFNIWNVDGAAMAHNRVEMVFDESSGLPTSATLSSQVGDPEDYQVTTTELDLSGLDDEQRRTLGAAVTAGYTDALDEVRGMDIPSRSYFSEVTAEHDDWGFDVNVKILSASHLVEEAESEYTYPDQVLVPEPGD